MKTGETGLDLLKHHEQLRLKAYKPTPNDKWTIGWGSTSGVKKGDVITEEQALERLRKDLSTAEECVNELVDVDLTQNQFDALVCFVFNVGVGAFRDSTLRRMLNHGQYDEAAKQFRRWNKQRNLTTGELEDLAGLTKRRRDEERLFCA